MALNNLAERRVRYARLIGNQSPFAAPRFQQGKDFFVHGRFAHSVLYPETDMDVNPHTDTSLTNNSCMATPPLKKRLIQIVKDNVKRRVDAVGQKPFAKRAGVGQSTVSRVLNGRQDITTGRLEMLARGAGCQPFELLIDGEEMRREIVERFLLPIEPTPAAAAPQQVPEARQGNEGGTGGIARTEETLPSSGAASRRHFAEETPSKGAKGTRRQATRKKRP